jgi:hypothetical protein
MSPVSTSASVIEAETPEDLATKIEADTREGLKLDRKRRRFESSVARKSVRLTKHLTDVATAASEAAATEPAWATQLREDMRTGFARIEGKLLAA